MNAPPATGSGLERALLGALERTLSAVDWLATDRPVRSDHRVPEAADATIGVRSAKGRSAELRVHVKAAVRPGSFPAWAEARRAPSTRHVTFVPLLATPFVSTRLAELCRQAGWSWHDLAGNCRIDIPGVLHIERTGLASPVRRPRPSANLGTAAAGRVLRVLLSPAHAGRSWTQRSLRKETCWNAHSGDEPVSLGLVNKVVRHLREEGLVEDEGDQGVRVRDPRGLLDAWNEAYRFDRHDRRTFFTLLKGAALYEALYRVGLDAGGMAAYAAFSAAERQAPHVRQPKTWLYLDAMFIDSLVQHTQAKEVDSGENLVVLVPDDAGVLVSYDANSFVGEQRLGCTDPVQTYVDLSHCGGRGEEAAQAILDQAILPAWRKAERGQ